MERRQEVEYRILVEGGNWVQVLWKWQLHCPSHQPGTKACKGEIQNLTLVELLQKGFHWKTTEKNGRFSYFSIIVQAPKNVGEIIKSHAVAPKDSWTPWLQSLRRYSGFFLYLQGWCHLQVRSFAVSTPASIYAHQLRLKIQLIPFWKRSYFLFGPIGNLEAGSFFE